MNGDDIAVWDTVHDPRTYGYAGDTDRANHGTRPIRHKHIHTGRRYGRVHVFQIHICNFNAEEIQLRAGTCLAKGKPCEPAVKIAAEGDEPGRAVLLGECAGAAHKGEKRQIKNSHWSTNPFPYSPRNRRMSPEEAARRVYEARIRSVDDKRGFTGLTLTVPICVIFATL